MRLTFMRVYKALTWMHLKFIDLWWSDPHQYSLNKVYAILKYYRCYLIFFIGICRNINFLKHLNICMILAVYYMQPWSCRITELYIICTLLNLAKGYSLASSVVRLQWFSTAPSVLAGFVNGTHLQVLTCFRPSLAFNCLYPCVVSEVAKGGESLK